MHRTQHNKLKALLERYLMLIGLMLIINTGYQRRQNVIITANMRISEPFKLNKGVQVIGLMDTLLWRVIMTCLILEVSYRSSSFDVHGYLQRSPVRSGSGNGPQTRDQKLP